MPVRIGVSYLCDYDVAFSDALDIFYQNNELLGFIRTFLCWNFVGYEADPKRGVVTVLCTQYHNWFSKNLHKAVNLGTGLSRNVCTNKGPGLRHV